MVLMRIDRWSLEGWVRSSTGRLVHRDIARLTRLTLLLGMVVPGSQVVGQQFRLGAERLALGSPDTAMSGRGTGVVFGKLAGAFVLESRVLVLDEARSQLLLFDSTGRLVDRFGRTGSGPGEFLSPRAVVRVGKTGVGVLDPRNSRMTVVEITANGMSLRGQFPVPVFAERACSVGSRIFLYLPLSDQPPIMEIDSLGTPIGRRFGERFGQSSGARNPIRERILSPAEMACSAESEMILLVSHWLPEAKAFSLDGEKRWGKVFPNLRPHRIEDTERGVRHIVPQDGIADVGASVFASPGGIVGVQFERLEGNFVAGRVVVGRKTFLLSKDGRVLGERDDLPPLIEVTAAQAVSLSNDPFPHLRIFSTVGR